jgi:hypothetical protein
VCTPFYIFISDKAFRTRALLLLRWPIPSAFAKSIPPWNPTGDFVIFECIRRHFVRNRCTAVKLDFSPTLRISVLDNIVHHTTALKTQTGSYKSMYGNPGGVIVCSFYPWKKKKKIAIPKISSKRNHFFVHRICRQVTSLPSAVTYVSYCTISHYGLTWPQPFEYTVILLLFFSILVDNVEHFQGEASVICYHTRIPNTYIPRSVYQWRI